MLDREASLYLDCWRILAAMTVFVGHVSGTRFTGGLFWQVAPFMGQAVMVFFVLSGFVIAYAAEHREQTASSYALARAARIYSVALPALVLTFVLDTVGRSIRPDLYGPEWGYVADGRLWQFLSGVLFVNDIWYLAVPQGSCLPYWSLGYEVPYYLLFGIALFAPPRLRAGALLAALVIIGPVVVSLFPIWLFGVFCYRTRLWRRLGWWGGAALCLVPLLVWAGYGALSLRAGHGVLEYDMPLGLPRETAEDYLIAALFGLHLIGFRRIAPAFAPLLLRLARPIRWFAGATFSIYLFHLPVAQFLATQVPWPQAAWQTRLVMFGGTLLIALALAELTERRKRAWRRGIVMLVPAARGV